MRLKALLVDDEVNILKNLAAVIPWDSLDIELIGTARNGEQAVELAKSMRPHLILCDIRMLRLWTVSSFWARCASSIRKPK